MYVPAAVLVLAMVSYALNCGGVNKYMSSNQCPCKKLSDGRLYSYDSRYLATDVEEAALSFPDLSMLNPPSPVDVRNPLTEGLYCTTEECDVCQNELRHRLKEIGLLSWQYVLRPQTHNTICKRYLFTQEKALLAHYNKKQSHGCDSSSSGSNNNCGEDDDGGSDETNKKKRKRWLLYSELASSAQDVSVIGVRFNISCSQKGVTVDTTGMVSLCSSCWVWRRLPSNYFPQFINELICDSSDRNCLSGYASCMAGTRTLSVLRNSTRGILTEVSLTAGTYCECKMKVDSALESLVTGRGISHSLSPRRT